MGCVEVSISLIGASLFLVVVVVKEERQAGLMFRVCGNRRAAYFGVD